MKILGGEPPFIENPEPRFGQVVIKLNELTSILQTSVGDTNVRLEEMLDELSTSIDSFVGTYVVPMDQHFNARGPQHGETKKTVGLGDKDNFRVATIPEHINYSDVGAFVVPAGVKASVAANNQQFSTDLYQQNFLFQFASYYHPNLYPLKTLTRPEGTRYYEKDNSVGVMINGDRLLFSPASNPSIYEGQNIHVSLATKVVGKGRLSEITNLVNQYTTNGWNITGTKITNTQVALFKTLANKDIFDYKSQLGLQTRFQNFLLYKNYAATVYKGIAAGANVSASQITLYHKLFSVDSFEDDPTLKEAVAASYLGRFTTLGVAAFNAPANGSHVITLSDYVTGPAGSTITFDTAREPIVSLVWDSQDFELLMHVVAPITARLGAVQTTLYLEFVERVRPGTMVAGGSATFTQINRGAKDTLNAQLLPVTSNWVKVNDKTDFSSPAWHPGVFLNSGEIVKAKANKFGLRVKRFRTTLPDVKSYLTATTRPKVPVKEINTQLFTPMRHGPFTTLPERVIPVSHVADRFGYLVYGVNSGTGLHEWTERIWGLNSMVSAQVGNKFGVMMPTGVDEINVPLLPKTVVSIASRLVDGITLSATAFTPQNNYKAVQSLTYNDGIITVGEPIELSPLTTVVINSAASAALARAAVANPAVNANLRVPLSFVFKITATKALFIVTDGVNYAEAGVTTFREINGFFELNFDYTSGIKLTRVTPTNQTVTGTNRESSSGDRPWFDYSDLLVLNTATGSYDIALTRAFGNVYGDLSFSISNFTAVTPTFTPGRLNSARLYSGTEQIDIVNELLPPLLIPRKGLYLHDDTNTNYASVLREVSGVGTTDPFDVNEAGWVRVPAGGRAVLWGGSFILDKEYSIKTFTTGKTYCYLVRRGVFLSTLSSSSPREPSNNEVLFGVAENGILTLNRAYFVMDDKLISSERKGATVPVFIDDGNLGINTFFTRRDIID